MEAKYPLPSRVNLFDYIKKSNIAIRIRAFRYKHDNIDKQFDLLKLHLLKSKKVLKEKYPNAKFVVVVYNDKCDCMLESVKFLDTDRWSELEDKDFIVINLNKPEFDYLNKEEYMAIDMIHPSGKAWEKLVPVISGRLNIK